MAPTPPPPPPPPDPGTACPCCEWHPAQGTPHPFGEGGDCPACLAYEVRRLQDAAERMRAACLALVRTQPYYPDTHTGLRQQWVKDQIAAAIDALPLP